MRYDFDTIVDRRDTDSLKYDFALQRKRPAQALPLWVADMDFPAPPEVLEALHEKTAHGIFGYSDARQDYFEPLSAWFLDSFDWRIQDDWLVKTPGVVFAVCTAINALTEPGDAVLIQQPVYYPFASSVEDNGRRLVVNQLAFERGRYEINFDDFEKKIVENDVRLFILCNPHNPVGRVFTRTELRKLGEICVKHGVLVVSDEIHADFVYPGHRHLVFADIDPAFADIAVTCTAPSKTFNLAALQISNVFISNQRLRRRFKQALYRTGYSQPNVMGLVACKAAYAHGRPWLDQLNEYLLGNLNFLRAALAPHSDRIRLVEPEGTYLAWLDCRGMNLPPAALDDWFLNEAGLWLDDGPMFGAGGAGFARINIACPRKTLAQALDQLGAALGRNPKNA